ncbi:rhombosortase [Alishewanella sp. d11]|uniref:rhombosortase n=1 Tax=Alishewanella sp. d11 TaxID=3414030 RepID=UPI003BF7778E
MQSHLIKTYLPYLVVAVLITVLYFCPKTVQLTLEYNSLAIEAGQLWRLLTGHFLHSNLYHLLMNLCGLFVIMLLHAPLKQRLAFAWQVLVISLATSLCLWFFAKDLTLYVGLSGVLHGILCFGAVLDIRQGFRSGILILLGVAVKLAFEQYFGPDAELAAKLAAEVAIDAHLFGAICGVLLGLALFSRTPHR